LVQTTSAGSELPVAHSYRIRPEGSPFYTAA
jgi:hypothetical protein